MKLLYTKTVFVDDFVRVGSLNYWYLFHSTIAVVLICTAVFQRKNLVTDERGPLENGASVI